MPLEAGFFSIRYEILSENEREKREILRLFSLRCARGGLASQENGAENVAKFVTSLTGIDAMFKALPEHPPSLPYRERTNYALGRMDDGCGGGNSFHGR